jgi:hypothetical protein
VRPGSFPTEFNFILVVFAGLAAIVVILGYFSSKANQKRIDALKGSHSWTTFNLKGTSVDLIKTLALVFWSVAPSWQFAPMYVVTGLKEPLTPEVLDRAQMDFDRVLGAVPQHVYARYGFATKLARQARCFCYSNLRGAFVC